jgi:phosphohistidine swiveling domain-containing protein
MAKLYTFPGTIQPELGEVGGKGHSLIRMAGLELPVPPGFVLAVEFFTDWFRQLRATPQWTAFLESPDQPACSSLKTRCLDLEFTELQIGLLDQALDSVPTDALFAVRSSSPEEDLAGSSFAGGYETVLGVNRETLQEAIRTAFASCLDYRVVVYKRENDFDIQSPQIAVVVQQQIASEVAGVGFSLNPVSNCFDEAIINANWGQGETVVAGLATPDTYTVDRITREILNKDLGSKELSIILTEGGGTEEVAGSRSSEFCLDSERILELADLIGKVEFQYGRPVDIEWALADQKLYLLQARPITTHTPLHDDMVTAPGSPKRLYLDITISVQGLLEPMSVAGTSALGFLMRAVSKEVFGKDITGQVETSVPFTRSGRIYMNLSNIFAILGKDKFATNFRDMDPTVSDILNDVLEDEYKSRDPRVRSLPLNALWKLPEKAVHVLEARLMPEKARQNSLAQVETFRSEVLALMDQDVSMVELSDTLFEKTVHLLFVHTIPLFVTARVAMGKIRKIVGEDVDCETLFHSLPGNKTVEMGLELFAIARGLPPSATAAELIENQAAIVGWAEFLEKYGHRGPAELDLRSPRYRDQPDMLLNQLVQLRDVKDSPNNPQAIFDKGVKEREESLVRMTEVIESKGWVQRKRFAALYKVVETLGGMRETHKFHVIFALDKLRTRILSHGERLVEEGRLSAVTDVFDLTLAQMDDQAADLGRCITKNRELPDQLSRLARLPRIIDSRGSIRRPPRREAREGEVVGMPISPGTVSGPVKVLHRPDEKVLEPGDILVARATDPGWTPLFVNAGAVILEVGGVLQHGALVAREYGKPCVSGVQGVTELWTDGTMVEVDGAAGIIRVLS